MIGPIWTSRPDSRPGAIPPGDGELVVLLDAAGNAIGTAQKLATHTADTPLHLAFSCYLFNDEGQLLLSQRAVAKRVFPGVWTNSVCGHPAPGEGLGAAVRRRASFELGLTLADLRLVLPGFRYRAEMAGIVENELCPVLVARVDGQPQPNPAEVATIDWVAWPDFVPSVLAHGQFGGHELSPWCRMQVEALAELGPDPRSWPDGDPGLLPPALAGGSR